MVAIVLVSGVFFWVEFNEVFRMWVVFEVLYLC